jgi:hypothetical protein
MRTNTDRKLTPIVLAVVMVSLVAPRARAIPPDPDNAALLYYQGFLALAELDDAARDLMGDVAKGKVDPNDKVREYIGQCRGGIEFAEAAVDVPNCHWGFRFSRGFDALMPQLAQVRHLVFVLLADARVRAADGDYRGALERCLMTDALARHVGDDTLISYLVSIAVRGLGYRCMVDVVGQAADDASLLKWLQSELATTSEREVTPVRALKIEMEIVLSTLRMENAEQYARLVIGEEGTVEEILAQVSEELFKEARQLYSKCAAEAITVLASSVPYDQAHPRLDELMNGFDPNEPASAVAGALAPAISRIYTLKTRNEADGNALKAGIDICLRKTESGTLPTKLPVGLLKDPFSGKDFEYERTDDGFVLRCRGKDLDKDIAYEYAFTLK